MNYYELYYMWKDDEGIGHIEGGWILKTNKTPEEMIIYTDKLTELYFKDSGDFFYANPIDIIEGLPGLNEIKELISNL